MKHLKYINEAVGSIDERRAVNESTAKNVLKDAINALTKTFAGKKLNKSYVKDYLASMERMARKSPREFVKDYMNFSNDDWIEDVEYNMANENTNEAINLDKIFMKGKSHPITDASTMKEIKKIYPKAKKTSDVHGAVFYIELAKDLYAKAFSENTFKSEEPFKIEAIYRMKGNKQHFLYQESVNENVKDAAFNLDKIFGDDQESIETFQDIEDNGDWKDMVDYINNWGNEEMLQRYGIRNDAQIKKLAKYIMRESVELNEAAPRMKKSKEEMDIEKSMAIVSGLKKGGAGNRYGKEFDRAKNKALAAINDMLTYAKIGI